jgi:archaetidylinositol phosphate synthase
MSHDTIVHRIVRPGVRVLANTRITPDHLTALRFATGLAAAAAFALGGRGWVDIGAAMFLLSGLLDRADGELARQTSRFSHHGHRYDLFADWSAATLTFIGLGIGAWAGPLGLAAPLLGVLAAAGVTLLFWGINASGQSTLPHYAAGGGRVLADPDDAMFAIPPLLWCFGAAGVLVPAGIATPLLAVLWIARLRWSVSPRSEGPGLFGVRPWRWKKLASR